MASAGAKVNTWPTSTCLDVFGCIVLALVLKTITNIIILSSGYSSSECKCEFYATVYMQINTRGSLKISAISSVAVKQLLWYRIASSTK